MSNTSDKTFRVCQPSSPMRSAPQADAECTNECLYGERVQLAHVAAGENRDFQSNPETTELSSHDMSSEQWLQVSAHRDGYRGYMRSSELEIVTGATHVASHWVSTRSTLAFSEASIKSRVIRRLPFLSQVVVKQTLINGQFHEQDDGTFIWCAHLLPMNKTIQISAIELARSHFFGAPYLWGGCSPAGLDCSGLIQALATAKGLIIPRDSGDQEKALKRDIPVSERAAQDIVYWPGHTGILLDSNTLLHATAHSLSCVVEPLQDVIDRAGDISSVKRLFD